MDLQLLEIISIIVANLVADLNLTGTSKKKPSLKTYACVSNRWQAVVERYIFRTISIEPTDLNHFIAIFSNSRRRGILKNLNYAVLPYVGSNNAGSRLKTSEEKRKSTFLFVREIGQLFDVLSEWQNKDGCMLDTSNTSGPARYSLSLVHSRHRQEQLQKPVKAFDEDWNMKFYESGKLSLPLVLSIAELHIEYYLCDLPFRFLDGILAAVPQIRSLHLSYEEPAMKLEAQRREQWKSLGEKLNLLISGAHSLRILHLYCEYGDPWNHNYQLGDMRQPGETVDMTSMAFRNLAMCGSNPITELNLGHKFLVSRQLFWPDDEENDKAYWRKLASSKLEFIDIDAGLRAPEGFWYYTGDPGAVEPEDFTDWGSDSDDELNLNQQEDIRNGHSPQHFWRNDLDSETFDPLLTAMVRVVPCLPNLKRLEFTISNIGSSVYVEYASAGERGQEICFKESEDERYRRRWRIWLGVDLKWELPSKTEALMKEWVGEEGVRVYKLPC